MAKARTSLRHAEAIDVHEDDMGEDQAEETQDESMNPLDESGRTADSSDEEVEDSVQEDMARFEETFVGISKRFRLINRIGEGMSTSLACSMQGSGLDSRFPQEPSPPSTRLRISNTPSTTTIGTSTSARRLNLSQHTRGNPPESPATSQSRRSTLRAVRYASSTSSNCCLI